MENPIKMDDLGVPLFLETPIFGSFQQKTPRIPQEVWLDPSWVPGGLLDPFAAATSGRMGFFRGSKPTGLTEEWM